MRTGTTGFEPMYPMIPHMSQSLARAFFRSRLLPTHPSMFVCRASRDAERAGRHVLCDRRAGRDVGALADAHRRNQLRVAADERAVLDDRRMLL